MAVPQTRKQFKEYIMRRLGFPVIEINVDAEQVEDRIDDALSYYIDYHFDGSEAGFFKHQITADDITNGYIIVPSNINGITKMVDGSGLYSSGEAMFNVNYQMALNDFFNITSQSVVPYYLAIRHINLFQDLFNGTPGIRFNRKTDRLYVDTNWNNYQAGRWLVFDCYTSLDPNTTPQIWGDKWLLRYATALVKRQMGINTKKFQNIQILGGQMMNGKEIYDEAQEEIKELEEEMIHSYSIPLTDMFGPGL